MWFAFFINHSQNVSQWMFFFRMINCFVLEKLIAVCSSIDIHALRQCHVTNTHTALTHVNNVNTTWLNHHNSFKRQYFTSHQKHNVSSRRKYCCRWIITIEFFSWTTIEKTSVWLSLLINYLWTATCLIAIAFVLVFRLKQIPEILRRFTFCPFFVFIRICELQVRRSSLYPPTKRTPISIIQECWWCTCCYIRPTLYTVSWMDGLATIVPALSCLLLSNKPSPKMDTILRWEQGHLEVKMRVHNLKFDLI